MLLYRFGDYSEIMVENRDFFHTPFYITRPLGKTVAIKFCIFEEI